MNESVPGSQLLSDVQTFFKKLKVFSDSRLNVWSVKLDCAFRGCPKNVFAKNLTRRGGKVGTTTILTGMVTIFHDKSWWPFLAVFFILTSTKLGVSVDMFYSGCVVAEVRDYRQVPPCSSATASGMSPGSGPSWGVTPPSRLVLLRPSTQSIICDSQALAKSVGQTKWTSDERNSLESQVKKSGY